VNDTLQLGLWSALALVDEIHDELGDADILAVEESLVALRELLLELVRSN
jgi:hypothetical protein